MVDVQGSNFFTKKDAKQYLKSMFATQGSGGNSDSSDSDEEDLWQSGLNQAEQLHVLASTNINPNERNLEFDKDDLKRYL